MPVHVTEERLLAPVHHLHRPAGAQREQADVHLQADVFARAERATDTGERRAAPFEREAEARGDLVAVDVQPLRRDVELDAAAVVVGHGEAGLGSEEGLVLHPDLVEALDDDRAGRVGIAVPDAHVAEEVAVGVDRRRVERRLRIGERIEHLVLDRDRGHRAARRLGVVGGDRGDRLADVADDVAREHRLVGVLEPVRRRDRARRRP